jgi:hypothetical protein
MSLRTVGGISAHAGGPRTDPGPPGGSEWGVSVEAYSTAVRASQGVRIAGPYTLGGQQSGRVHHGDSGHVAPHRVPGRETAGRAASNEA